MVILLWAHFAAAGDVHQWGLFDVSFKGPAGGNPFVDVQLSADFVCGENRIHVNGFYDGDGVYRVHFMPTALGVWRFRTQSNCAELDEKSGEFVCVAPSAGNHGPVRVSGVHHFAYSDGTPFVCMGTTCYGWAHEPEGIEEQTLATLKSSPFNKVRMCLIPSEADPVYWPYARKDIEENSASPGATGEGLLKSENLNTKSETNPKSEIQNPKSSDALTLTLSRRTGRGDKSGSATGEFDQTRFNPAYFRHLEKRIQQLGDEGIEADLILFHPYKKQAMSWFDDLDDAGDERYLKYVVARLAAYRNVWWSLANEYGQVKHKTDADWDHFFQVVAANDPYDHLRSIHNAAKFYDANKPWVSHACVQNGSAVADFGRAVIYRELWQKPVVLDEVCYEGNINRRWGSLTAEQMVERFWLGTIAGGYVGHGEVYSNPPLGVAWTSGGGKLVGQSPARLAFLRGILESGPAEGIEPIDEYYETRYAGKAGEYYLVYFGREKPTSWRFMLPQDPPNKRALAPGRKFRVEVLDTWNMTITPVEQIYTLDKPVGADFPAEGEGNVKLPGRAYMALRIQRVESSRR